PITPDDVIFTFQAITAANLAVGAGQEGYELITSVERAGPNGGVLHFRSVFPAFRNLFSVILPRHRLQGLTPDHLAADPYWSTPAVVFGVSLVEDVARDHVTLIRTPPTANGRPGMPFLGRPAYADRVVCRAFPSRQAVLAALKAGDVQADVDLTERELTTV